MSTLWLYSAWHVVGTSRMLAATWTVIGKLPELIENTDFLMT